MIKKTTYLLIILFSLISTAHAVPSAPWEIDELMDKPAPDFTLKSVVGEEMSMSQFKGKVVLLNFWATWCPPCIHEMPSMNRLYNTYKSEGFDVIAVSNDNSIKKIRKFTDKYPVDFIILSDSTLKAYRSYKVFTLPTSFIIDKKGTVIRKFIGQVNWMDEDIQNEIKTLLKPEAEKGSTEAQPDN